MQSGAGQEPGLEVEVVVVVRCTSYCTSIYTPAAICKWHRATFHKYCT